MPPAYTAFSAAVPVIITGYAADAMEPFIAKDGRYLFFNNRNDSTSDTNIYYAARIDDATFRFLGALGGVNSPQLDAVASLDTLGNFYFVSTRSYSTTLSTIYCGHFSPTGVSDVALVVGVSLRRPGWVNFDAEISADGQTLWFNDGQYSMFGRLRTARIAMADRRGDRFTRRADAGVLLASVNAAGLNYAPSISADGRELFFTHIDAMTSRASPAIYRATRADTASAFGVPQRVTAAAGFVEAPSLSADGHLLYFHVRVGSKYAIYVMRR